MAPGLADYGAIDRLGIAPTKARDNGWLVAEKVQIGFACIVFRDLGTAVPPLDTLKRLPTVIGRLASASCSS